VGVGGAHTHTYTSPCSSRVAFSANYYMISVGVKRVAKNLIWSAEALLRHSKQI
jgi:hypothetical protein